VPVGQKSARSGSLTAARPRRIFTAFPDACADKKSKFVRDVNAKIKMKIAQTQTAPSGRKLFRDAHPAPLFSNSV
jgi:hypothetical protein